MDMQIILMSIIGILGGKQFWDYIKKWQAIRAEKEKLQSKLDNERNLEARKLSTEERNEIKEMLNSQIDEYKKELLSTKEDLKQSQQKIMELEINYAKLEGKYDTIRERLLRYTQHSRGKGKSPEDDLD